MKLSDYIQAVPKERRAPFRAICRTVQNTIQGCRLTFRYDMPTYTRDDHWVAVANQKYHIGIYFSSRNSVQHLLALQPNLQGGKGCIRLRDGQPVDLAALEAVIIQQLDGE